MRYCFLFILLNSVLVYGQSRWIKQIHSETETLGTSVIESYDNGLLISGKFGSDYVNFYWLQKKDVNGQFLWEKVIGDEHAFVNASHIKQSPNGAIYISGNTTYYDSYRDPLAIKLNTCGDKEWCKVFNTPGNFDYSNDIISTDDGGCVILMNNTGPDSNYYAERTGLAKLSSDGELIWRHDYNSPDDHSQGEILYNLLETTDRGFLMTGYIYYEDPTVPGRYWSHPYYIKTDSLGNFEWETIVHKEIWEIGGAAWSTTLNPDSTFFYSSISHYYHSPSTACPALLKMDFNGTVIDIYDVVEGYKDGMLWNLTFLNDNTLAAYAGWGNTEDSLWSYAVIIDTLGNLLNSTVLMYDLYTSIQHVTYDGKLVYLSNTNQNGQFSCYLTKLNQNLEGDTLYTRPFTYDSLCPYQIVSDTIVQDDCGLIVGVEEPGGGETGKPGSGEVGERGSLEIWPNPCREVLSFKVLGLSAGFFYSLIIYDIFGREIRRIKIPDGQDEVIINIESYPPGLYIAILKNGLNIVESRKFVIAR